MQSLDEVTLERWLRAENFNVDKAEKKLRAHAIWRRDEFPEGRVLEVRKLSQQTRVLTVCLLELEGLCNWTNDDCGCKKRGQIAFLVVR